ncbi:hypothetical protein HAV15_003264 [Penicillium sp. str. |nr:hypothetical protein HAV15_003264 [Penicillium sp. str. \
MAGDYLIGIEYAYDAIEFVPVHARSTCAAFEDDELAIRGVAPMRIVLKISDCIARTVTAVKLANMSGRLLMLSEGIG